MKTMCETCNNYTEKVEPMTNRYNSKAWYSIYEQYMEVFDDRKDGNILSFKINYCPNCGDKLN